MISMFKYLCRLYLTLCNLKLIVCFLYKYNVSDGFIVFLYLDFELARLFPEHLD